MVIKSKLNLKDEQEFPNRHKNGKAKERPSVHFEISESRRRRMATIRSEHILGGKPCKQGVWTGTSKLRWRGKEKGQNMQEAGYSGIQGALPTGST